MSRIIIKNHDWKFLEHRECRERREYLERWERQDFVLCRRECQERQDIVYTSSRCRLGVISTSSQHHPYIVEGVKSIESVESVESIESMVLRGESSSRTIILSIVFWTEKPYKPPKNVFKMFFLGPVFAGKYFTFVNLWVGDKFYYIYNFIS